LVDCMFLKWHLQYVYTLHEFYLYLHTLTYWSKVRKLHGF
jgi:hypothetical protein